MATAPWHTHTHKKSMQAWHTSITHVLKHEHSQWNCHDRPCPSALKFAEACGCHGPATARNQTAHLQLLAKSMRSWTPRSQSTHMWTKSSKCFPEYKPVEKSLSPSLQPAASTSYQRNFRNHSSNLSHFWQCILNMCIFGGITPKQFMAIPCHFPNMPFIGNYLQAILAIPFQVGHGPFFGTAWQQRQRQFYGSS